MTDTPKLTREQQLAQWRKQQKQKSQQNIKTWGTRIKKDFLKIRLRFWGIILMIAGLMTLALNVVFVFQGKMPVASSVFAGWGLVLIVVAILDFIKVSTGMLTLTGVIALIHGLLILVSGNIIMGPVIFIAGILMLRDASRAKKQEKERQTVEQASDA